MGGFGGIFAGRVKKHPCHGYWHGHPAHAGTELMDTGGHTYNLRKGYSPGRPADWTRRNPLLLFRFAVLFLLRLAERRLFGLLFQEPPRNTRERLRPDPHPSQAGYSTMPAKIACRNPRVSP